LCVVIEIAGVRFLADFYDKSEPARVTRCAVNDAGFCHLQTLRQDRRKAKIVFELVGVFQ